uniref:Uncharacterized protein n=1 Tax=Aegilops tauschii subsp. strangulata TaxID=200361 RepID=A0A453J297_AEGTS
AKTRAGAGPTRLLNQSALVCVAPSPCPLLPPSVAMAAALSPHLAATLPSLRSPARRPSPAASLLPPRGARIALRRSSRCAPYDALPPRPLPYPSAPSTNGHWPETGKYHLD